ncbi:TPA: hypothetical protein ACQ7D9_005368, partial [Klebsiella pneumoniae]
YLPDTVGEDLSLYFARESGVLLEGGLLFVDNGEGHIRLNLACPRTMLTAGMKRISQVLRTPAPNRVEPLSLWPFVLSGCRQNPA